MCASKVVIGIDPGLKGGCSATDGETFVLAPLKYLELDGASILDTEDLDLWLMEVHNRFGSFPDAVFLERVHNFPTDSRKSAFTFGFVAGQVVAYFKTRGFMPEGDPRMYLVRPKTWQHLLDGFILTPDSPTRAQRQKALKQASVLYMEEKYPDVSLLATGRSKVPHTGLADAAVLSLWGLSFNTGDVIE